MPDITQLQFIFKNTHKTPHDRNIYIDAFKDGILRFAATLPVSTPKCYDMKVQNYVAIYLGTPVYVMLKFDLVKFRNYNLSSLKVVICGAAPLSAYSDCETGLWAYRDYS
ncbi:hypothetical protein BDF21DRAFT_430392 [Thamnidium elegans]|uniref:Uncharacterized protein n=1 Tax=Thamnidium elegans TaxID=101142 RepID=A0A8H7STE1_9FUNG|nr:hypothetical protein INT48_003563 [Thamnidium elegans]KAI8057434.1 hypothetical protein BDF21DRAFT_430392 [Thamnidium elegans]